MRGFLLLSVVGALLYGLLVLTADLPDRKVEHSLSGHTARPADRTLRSWGSNLPALVSEQPSNDRPSPAVRDKLFDVSQEKLAEGTVGGALQAQLETAKVVLAARVHSEPSVTPTSISTAPVPNCRSSDEKAGGWSYLTQPLRSVDGSSRAMSGPLATSAALKLRWVCEMRTSSRSRAQPTQSCHVQNSGADLQSLGLK